MIKNISIKGKGKGKDGEYNLTEIVDNTNGLKYIEFFFPKFPYDYCFESLKILIDEKEYLAERPPIFFNFVEYLNKMDYCPENRSNYMCSFSYYPQGNIEKDFICINKNTNISFIFEGLKEENTLCLFTLHLVEI